MNKKRLKKISKKTVADPNKMTLREKRIIRTKEKMLLQKAADIRAKRQGTKSSPKSASTKPEAKSGGCGGCRRKNKNR